MTISLLAYLATFSGQLYSRRSYFFNYFNTKVALLEHLFLQSSYFFSGDPFGKSHFLAAVIFSEYLIVRNDTSTENPL